MPLETATYIDGLNASNPAASDAISSADDHMRLIKSTIKATFPNVAGAVTKTHSQLNNALDKTGDTMTGALTLSGAPSSSLHAATKAYVDSVAQNTSSGNVPSGGIIMWSGAVNAVPNGWFLCNGSNGTPDLRNRFIVGAGSSYSVGDTGGSADAIVVSHTHTATSTVTDPGHTHVIPNTRASQPNGGSTQIAGAVSGGVSSDSTNSSTTGITVATTVSSTGSSGTNANLPPYYALAYIMKA